MTIEARPVQVIEAPEITADEWGALIAAAGAVIGAIVAATSD